MNSTRHAPRHAVHAARLLAPLIAALPVLSACTPREPRTASTAASKSSGAARAVVEMSMKIRLTVDGHAATATLDDTDVARDFAALLPITLTLEDYAVVERIATLPRRLAIDGAPAGTRPANGDITYYAPWGNLAIFVEGQHADARGLVRLGRVDAGLPSLQRPGPFEATLERVAD